MAEQEQATIRIKRTGFPVPGHEYTAQVRAGDGTPLDVFFAATKAAVIARARLYWGGPVVVDETEEEA